MFHLTKIFSFCHISYITSLYKSLYQIKMLCRFLKEHLRSFDQIFLAPLRPSWQFLSFSQPFFVSWEVSPVVLSNDFGMKDQVFSERDRHRNYTVLAWVSSRLIKSGITKSTSADPRYSEEKWSIGIRSSLMECYNTCKPKERLYGKDKGKYICTACPVVYCDYKSQAFSQEVPVML